MYQAEIRINNKIYCGTLTFIVLKRIQKVIKKEFDRNVTVSMIFEELSQYNMETFSAFLIETLCGYGNYDKDILVSEFTGDTELLEKFTEGFKYIDELIEECMPKPENKQESIFEDFEEENLTDWEFDHMEYLWNTTLKRTDFWNVTPKNFFEQLKIHKKNNNIKDEVRVEEV